MKDTYFAYHIRKELLNEYGLNYYEPYNSYEDYEHFYITKNNLNLHEKILKK